MDVVVRAAISDGAFRLIRIAAGGIAPVPIRLEAAESALQDATVNDTTIQNAIALSTSGAKPLAMTGYKLALLRGLVRDLLEKIVT